jgi:hypothetical protein
MIYKLNAPTVPPSLTVPTGGSAGASKTISWGASTADPAAGLAGYRLECSINGGAYTAIYTGTALTYTHTVPTSAKTVQYRVMATGLTSGTNSAYRTGNSVTVTNSAPSTPASISYPSSMTEGASVTVSWGASTDPEGGAVTYYLERSLNGGTYTQIYSGTARSSASGAIPVGTTSVTFRVRAADPAINYSAYRTGSAASVAPASVAPNAPTSITLPATILAGQSFAISWSEATDPDGDLVGYYLERSINGGGAWTQIYQGSAASTTDILTLGATTSVMYRVNAYDGGGRTSAWYTSTAKTVVNNVAPGVPADITVPASVTGGASLIVSWGASTDSDGNLSGYRLERQYNGGAWTQIYQGSTRTYTDAITKGWTTVAYRVKAYDSYGAESGYQTSATRTVDNNAPPTISSGSSGDLGTKDAGFSVDYSVDDEDGDAVTVTEKIDGVTIRTYAAILEATNTFDVTGDTFMKLLNGSRTMQIVATDSGGKSATLALTFTKAVHSCSVTMAEPFTASALVTKMVMSVVRSIPQGANFQVLVTNNPFDDEPVWEDATTSVVSGINHLFNNTTVTNGHGLNFKILVDRGMATSGGFIASIGGAFE